MRDIAVDFPIPRKPPGANQRDGAPGSRPCRTGSWRRLAQIDGGDLLLAEDDVVDAVGRGRAQRHRVAEEGAADPPGAVAEPDLAALLHLADDRARPVIELRQRLGEEAPALAVARRRRRQPQRLVR